MDPPPLSLTHHSNRGRRGTGRTKISHLANKQIKALLSNCASSAILCDGELKMYYHLKVQQGKPKIMLENLPA